MLERRYIGPYHTVSRKWLDLAERRKAHIIELYESGRWRHYYTEAQLAEEIRAAITACDEWEKIVGRSPLANKRPPAPQLPELSIDEPQPAQRYRA
jgi:uncharacterized repeat protein (TIGR03809 family)